MKPDTYREHLNDLQLEVEELRAKLKEAQTGDLISRAAALDVVFNNAEHPDKAYEAIRHLPSAQPKMKCIANVTLTDEQVKKAFEKAKCEILATQPDYIRCRDCMYAEFKPGATIHCKELGADLYQWDYCSYAERRTDDSISD